MDHNTEESHSLRRKQQGMPIAAYSMFERVWKVANKKENHEKLMHHDWNHCKWRRTLVTVALAAFPVAAPVVTAFANIFLFTSPHTKETGGKV